MMVCLTCPSTSRRSHALSSDFWRTLCRKFLRLISCASSRRRTTGFRRAGRDAYLNFGCWIGDDCTWRCGRELVSIGDRGEDARIGDDERGDETAGRYGPQCSLGIGVGANESILFEEADSFPFFICEKLGKGEFC